MFENVLVGVDNREGGRDAIALARQLAAPGTQLTLAYIHAIAPMRGPTGGLVLDSDLEDSQRLLERRSEEGSPGARLVVGASESVGVGLQRLADRHDVDLIVIGSTHRGPLGRILGGDDTRATLHGSARPVAVAPGGYAERAQLLGRIGVGFDGSHESVAAFAAARELANRHGATLSTMSVVWTPPVRFAGPPVDEPPEAAKRRMHEQLRSLPGADQLQEEVIDGESPKSLAHFSEGLDLLVVGSRGQGLVARLVNGSTSDYLARHSHCPLLVVPEPQARASSPRSATGHAPAHSGPAPSAS